MVRWEDRPEMIVSSTPFGARLVTQSDHARLAADILRLFRIPELLEHPRRETLLRAVAEHDNGWWEADAAPSFDAEEAAALDFRSQPAAVRQEIWRRGVERFAGADPYLAALVATHALRLFRRIPHHPMDPTELPDPSWAALRSHLALRREELLAAAGETLATLELDDPWLEVADDLSLAVCTGDPAFVSLPGWRVEVADDPVAAGAANAPGAIELALEPFPLAGATSFELSCRWLAPGNYLSAVELARALASSTWRRVRVRVHPL